MDPTPEEERILEAELLEKLPEGIADADAARLIPADVVFAKLRARHAQRIAERDGTKS